MKSFTLAELARHVNGELTGRGDAEVSGITSMGEAGPSDITFISDVAHARQWSACKAGAVVISRSLCSELAASTRPVIVVANAEHASIALLELFKTPEPVPDIGVHESAVVHSDAQLAQGVRIGPLVSVDRGARIGDGVVLHAGVRIYADVVVGAGSVIHANTVIRHGCTLGRGVILHQNVSIGADGFGYRPDPRTGGLVKVPHIGNVIIEDGVEIGANSCVDRGKFGSTVIGAGTKIDNLCQIAHNCRIGRCCVIAGQCALAGSVTLGDGVQMGGRAGIADHITVGAGARIGANSGVTKDIDAGRTVLGFPADDAPAVLRQWSGIRKLPDLIRRLSRQLPSEER